MLDKKRFIYLKADGDSRGVRGYILYILPDYHDTNNYYRNSEASSWAPWLCERLPLISRPSKVPKEFVACTAQIGTTSQLHFLVEL